MSFSATAVQALTETHNTQVTTSHEPAAMIAAALVFTMAATTISRKQIRRMKRRAVWSFFKAKLKSLFTGRDTGISTRTLLYILIGLGVLILAFVAPVAAIILLLLGVILLLANR